MRIRLHKNKRTIGQDVSAQGQLADYKQQDGRQCELANSLVVDGAEDILEVGHVTGISANVDVSDDTLGVDSESCVRLPPACT